MRVELPEAVATTTSEDQSEDRKRARANSLGSMPTDLKIDQAKKTELIGMGFEEAVVVTALAAADNKLDLALDRLLNPSAYENESLTSTPAAKRAKPNETTSPKNSPPKEKEDPKLAQLVAMGFDKARLTH